MFIKGTSMGTSTYPLDEAKCHELSRGNAVFEILQECFAVERVKLVEIAEQNVCVALQSGGHHRGHFLGHQSVSVSLQ